MRDKVINLSTVAVLLYLFTLSPISCKKQEPPTNTQAPTTPATTRFRVPQENLKIPEEMKACTANLQKIHAAIKKYETDKGTLPDWLSDLVPKYLSKEDLLSPTHPDRTKARYSPDPNLPCCYEYEFSPTHNQISSDRAFRDWKEQQVREFGDVVPIVRCLYHGSNIALNVSVGGQIYWSPWLWEAMFKSSSSSVPDEQPSPGESAPKTTGQAVEGMPSKIGDTAWNLKGLEFIKGTPVKIEPGKFYIVEFWATWCGPCLRSIPHLTEVAHKYKDKNVVVVGISKEQADVARPFMEKQGAKMDYNVAVDPTGNVTEGYMKAFDCRGIPHAFIVDAEGKIAWHGHPMADMEQVLDEVLAGTFDAAGYAGKKAEEQAKKAEEQAKFEAEFKTYQAYFEKIRGGGTMEEARAILGNWLDEASDDGLNSLAWKILTELEKDKRDVKLALDAAERANKLMEGKNGNTLDTYAMALFQNGKVEEAIEMQTKALEAAKKTLEATKKAIEAEKGTERMRAAMLKRAERTVAEFQKRLDEYRAAKKE